MYMLCCWVKIIWYIVLIFYHFCDVCLDWLNCHKLFEDKAFSGVSISTNQLTFEISFVISCATGTVFSIIMAVAYVYYISYHWDCIHHANYRSVSYSDGEYSIFGDRGCDKKCNRHFVTLELWVSALELLFKDDIQSIILFSLYTSQSFGYDTRPSWYSIAFSVCSVCAHFKLCICFMSKLCGCGSGEESFCNDDCSCAKAFACIIGFIGSALCLGFTVVSLVEAVSVRLRFPQTPSLSTSVGL